METAYFERPAEFMVKSRRMAAVARPTEQTKLPGQIKRQSITTKGGHVLADQKKSDPLKPYRHHQPTSYNRNLGYKPSPYNGNQQFKDMIQKAEQVMSDNEFKN
ncbi:MAG TPA: hypothetical protein VHR42_01745 [Clostridia bacterium]|nr:hypothetical protein [Clostridia bacterium]